MTYKHLSFFCKITFYEMHTSSMGTLRNMNSVLSVNNVKLSLEMVWNRVIIVNRDPAYFYLYIDSPNHPPPQKWITIYKSHCSRHVLVAAFRVEVKWKYQLFVKNCILVIKPRWVCVQIYSPTFMSMWNLYVLGSSLKHIIKKTLPVCDKLLSWLYQ